MKNPLNRSAALVLLASTSLFAGSAMAGIVGSAHDLGSSNATAVNAVSDTDETCVFCHTPHKASTPDLPLWNKQLTDSTAYSTYSSTTIDGETDFTGDFSTSMACLSCHDGTQAMDNIVNAPGSGGYDATGGGVNGLGYTWTTANSVDPATGILNAGALANLGEGTGALGDDHPISIQYAGGGIDTTNASPADSTGLGDPDFVVPSTANIGGTQKWWFDTNVDGDMDSNEVRLYTRTITNGSGNPEPMVECASCHDPHNPDNGTFLRTANTSSAVCTSCHVK